MTTMTLENFVPISGNMRELTSHERKYVAGGPLPAIVVAIAVVAAAAVVVFGVAVVAGVLYELATG